MVSYSETTEASDEGAPALLFHALCHPHPDLGRPLLSCEELPEGPLFPTAHVSPRSHIP